MHNGHTLSNAYILFFIYLIYSILLSLMLQVFTLFMFIFFNIYVYTFLFKRRRGRPQRRYMDNIREDMRELGAKETDTQDRGRWRSLTRCGNPD